MQEIANLPDTLLQEYLSFVVEKYFNDQVDSLQWAYESSKGKAREPAIQCFDACALRLAKATWKLERLKKVLSQAPALLLALSSHASAAMNLRDAVFQAPKHCTVSANALQILLNTVSSWAGQHAEALTALGVFPALVSLGVTHSAATAAASPAASSVQPAAAATAVAVEQESSTSFKGRMRAFALDLHEADTAAKGSVKCLQEQQAARIDEIAATEAETGRWAERAANAHDRLAVKHSEHMAWKYQPEVQAAMSKALVTLRSIVPPNICSMSQQNIFDDFAAEGIRMPPHLAAELKGNQLLPLLVLHSSALHKSKLALDSLEIYGLEELMALAAVLPDELENDPRKLKAEWMDSFYDCLMKKYNRFIGATELAEYDGVAGQRKQVTMTPLSDQEQVREVFFHEAAPELHLRVMNCQQREQEAKRLKGMYDLRLLLSLV